MPKLTVTALVATMTGSAELLAEDLTDEFEDACELDLVLIEDADPDDLAGLGVVLIVSSTYGVGEVPEPSKAFYARIEEAAPDLSGLIYGVISLGDSTYHKTFARGGQLWDELLSKFGARRLGDVLKVDANAPDEPLDLARVWFEAWLEIVRVAPEGPASAVDQQAATGR